MTVVDAAVVVAEVAGVVAEVVAEAAAVVEEAAGGQVAVVAGGSKRTRTNSCFPSTATNSH